VSGLFAQACPVSRWAQERPDHPAVVSGPNGWSYRDLEAQVASWAGRLVAVGVTRGDRVALLGGNRLELVAQIHAVGRLGAVAVMLNARLTSAELLPQIQLASPRVILAEPSLAPQVSQTGLLYAGPKEAKPVCAASRDPEADFAILFTSGTTGRSKAAVLTWGNFVASAQASAANLGGSPEDRWLATLNFFHVGGLAMLTRCALFGATLVLQGRFDPRDVNAAIDQGATHVSLVATTLARTLEARGDVPFPATLKGVLVGGGPVPPSLLSRARALGGPVLLTYGLTEACSQVTTERPLEADAVTAGPPLPGLSVRVVGEGGAVLPPGEVGEIEVRGPTVMRGYLGDPEATALTLVAGWLRTRDLGALDERGRLRVFARRTDLILTGGENVYPAEVEALLLDHPALDDVAVLGLADPVWGQRVVAAIVVKSAVSAVSDAELERFCRERLAGYKVPRSFFRRPALPRNATGKVDRAALRQQLDYSEPHQTS